MRALAVVGLSLIGAAMLALFIYLMLDSSNIDDDEEWKE